MKNIYFKILNIAILLLIILTFEFGYCNNMFLENLKSGQITTFHISICRIIVYFVMFILTLLFNKKNNFEETKELLKSKIKKVALILFILSTILVIITLLIVRINKTIYMTTLSLGIILWLTILIAIIYFTKDYTKNIVLIGIIATIFTVSTDTYHELDEKKYFMQAYNMSYFNINYSNPIVDTMFMYGMQPRDEIYKYYNMDYEYIENTLENMPEEYRGDSTPANYNNIFFLASASGILFARVFNGSMADIYVLGRLFNLILYIILMRYALKLMPFKKNILFLIASMPMLLALSASYSIDGLGFAFAMIFIASIFKVYDEKKTIIDTKILLTIFISFAILLSYKFMAYIFLGLLIFILPLKQILIQNKKKILYIFLITLVILIGLYISQFCVEKGIAINDYRGGDVNAIEQVKNVISHPLVFINALYNFLNTYFLNFNWISNLHMDIFFGKTSVNVFLIILLYYFYISVIDTSKNFNKKEKIIFIAIYTLTMLFITSIMYATFNPVGETIIRGVQARYMYPVLPLLLFVVSNNNLIKKDNKKDITLNVALMQIVIMYISVFETIIS